MAQLYKTVIIDDEPDAQMALSTLISRFAPQLTLVGTAASVEEGVALIEKMQPEVVFLDINMPPYTGFDMLRYFPQRDFEIIFCTAFDDYAIQALRQSAIDYLLKPVRPADLQEAVQRLMIALESPAANKANEPLNDRLVIPTHQGYLFSNIEDIILLQAESSYTTLYLKDGSKILSSRNLAIIEEMLVGHPFIRVHNSYLVNFSHIHSFMRNESYLVMSNKMEVPVALRRKEELMRWISDKK